LQSDGVSNSRFQVGVLDECQIDDSNLTQRILEIRLPHLRGFNKMRNCASCNALAVYGRRTHFLSHSATLALMDLSWFGHIDPQTPKINMMVTALVPVRQL